MTSPDPLKPKPETLGFEREARELADKLMTDARLRQNSPVDTIALALEAVFSKGTEEGYRKGKQAGGMDEAIGCQEHSMKAFDNGWNACKLEAAKVADRHAKECRGIEAYEGEGEALHILRDIRALKPAKGERE